MNGGLLASENLDISLVARWLDHCVNNHQETCSILRPDRGDREIRTMIKGGFRLGDDLRVIDVHAMKICSAPQGLSYCALSYLWGGISMLKTLKENFGRLSQDSGIVEEELPLTIRDAIHFCRKIGWQYLWVDALCIIQDDEVNVASQISQMQSIYRFADFTIVAASGVDSNAGLPGIQTARKVSQHMEKIQGLRLVTTLPPFEHIQETSRWSTRAWTFQESKLSRRLIIFSDGQMHFRCEGGEFCEDTRIETQSRTGEPGRAYSPFLSTSLLLGAPHGRGFDIFQDLVAQYSQKVLSYPEDILNGFSGIINALKPFGTIGQYWISGLPVEGSRLVDSLLWIPTYQHASELRRFNIFQTDFVQRPGKYVAIDSRNKRVEDGAYHKFPSWSWIGWMGDIDYLETPPATITHDCVASADYYILTINARILNFNVRNTNRGIPSTSFDVYNIEDSNGDIISDFIYRFDLVERDEVKRFEVLLLVTVEGDRADTPVRPRQWKPLSRYVGTAEAMNDPKREVHHGPYLNAMVISKPANYPKEPAERVALVNVPMKYWDAEGVMRQEVLIG
ncbi:hypothetical protein ONS95_010174 [Cadophora gregata]|uniref:uncharacterized protein n=1 Tax=Cadophora gregata TaxID=51156 RepID=UPI0026DC5A8D|nr:uncharacterized protein ONS95_010174 [Cadophora gregata]KAK0121897.1 hypothetical protein ONS95_010174 [Cadophora gregata]